MQNKGLIKVFAILFGLVSLYQLSFTFFANKVEDDAKVYAERTVTDNDARKKAVAEKKYLDSIANKEIIDVGVAQYTYSDIRDKEMNLGLDLKGGVNAILQVSVKEVLKNLSNDSKNEAFNQALATAEAKQKSSNSNYLDLFFQEFELTAGDTKLSDPAIFGTKALSDKISFNEDNISVKETLQEEINSAIGTAFEVLRSRIDKFGVASPNIQRIGNSGRIQIELPGAKDIERVTTLITSKAELQFWEVYSNAEVIQYLSVANAKSIELLKDTSVTEKVEAVVEKDDIDDLLGASADSTQVDQKMLFSYLSPMQAQLSSTVGYAKVLDTATVNSLLNSKEIRDLLPNELRYVKFLWDYKSFSTQSETENTDENFEANELVALYAIKSNRNDIAPLEGDVILDASQVFSQLNKPEVSMTMNSGASKAWTKTKKRR
jgi:SecD/SecF fusion protein